MYWSYTGSSWRIPWMTDCIICALACAFGLTTFGMMSVLMLISTPSNI